MEISYLFIMFNFKENVRSRGKEVTAEQGWQRRFEKNVKIFHLNLNNLIYNIIPGTSHKPDTDRIHNLNGVLVSWVWFSFGFNITGF